MAEREDRSRSRFAQGTIHPDEVAPEVAAIRAALGPDDEVRAFTQDRAESPGRRHHHRARRRRVHRHRQYPPAGLRDAIAALIGERRRIPFRVTPAVPRGEAALTRTDPVVGAVAALRAGGRPGPARARPALSPPAAAASSAPPRSRPGPRCCSSATATSSPSPAGYGDAATDRRGRPRARLRGRPGQSPAGSPTTRPPPCSPPRRTQNTAPEFARQRHHHDPRRPRRGAARGQPPRPGSSPPSSATRTAGSAAPSTRRCAA